MSSLEAALHQLYVAHMTRGCIFTILAGLVLGLWVFLCGVVVLWAITTVFGLPPDYSTKRVIAAIILSNSLSLIKFKSKD